MYFFTGANQALKRLRHFCATLAQKTGREPEAHVILRFMTDVNPVSQTRTNRTGAEEADEFRDRLQREFARRTQANPRYSLRAFAKSLGIYHATLSAIMTGRRTLTAKSIERIGISLGLSPSERANFTNKNLDRSFASSRKDFLVLADDEFDLIAGWRHDAILEYLQLPSNSEKNQDVRKIASRLGLGPADVMTSLQLLERTGQIVRDDKGMFRPIARNTSTLLLGPQTSVARRRHQKGLLKKSMDALEETPLEERDHTSIVMTIDADDLPELKETIRSFRKKLMAFAQRKNVVPNEVYAIQISLFPLTKKTEAKQ